MALTTQKQQGSTPIVQFDDSVAGHRPEVVIADGEIQGNVAHDTADSGNPVKIGAKAYDPDSPPSNVASGDRVNLIADLKGRLIVWLGNKLDKINDSVGVAPLSIPIEGSHDQDTSIDTATVITPTGDFIIMQATAAGKNVRYTLDGTTPTASLGFVMVAQDPPVRFPTAGKTFTVIAETAGAVLDSQDEQSA